MKIKEITESKYGPVLILAALSFVIYFNTLLNGYVYDDVSVVLENRLIRDLRNIKMFIFADVWVFDDSHVLSNFYRPAYNIVLTLQYHLWGLNAWGWHLGNIILHILNSVAAFLIFSILFKNPNGGDIEKKGSGELPATAFALIAALIFATHPVKTEAVAWISAFGELLTALFVLLSFYFYILSYDRARKALYILSVAAFFIAALCKETGLSLPLLIVAYDIIMRPRSLKKSIIRYLPFLMAAILYFIIRIVSLSTLIPQDVEHRYLTGFQYFINTFPLFIEHIKTLLVPVKLSVFHVFNPLYAITKITAVVSILFTIIILVIFFMLAKRERLYLLGFAIIVIPLLPALYIPALDRNPFAERYLYLPSTGFAIIIASAIKDTLGYFTLQKKRRFVKYILWAFVILIALYCAGTVKRNFEWKDRFSLWKSSVDKDPENYYALNELGKYHLSMEEYDDAIPLFKASIKANRSRKNPDLNILGNAHLSLADSFRLNAMTNEAIAEYETAIRMGPDKFDANFRVAILYQAQGAYDKALERYRIALKATEENEEIAGILMNIGNIYAQKGQWTKTLEMYDLALKAMPDDPLILRNRAIILKKSTNGRKGGK